MQLAGIHHLTAVTARAARNLEFYTGTLGMRLVKKTVNQDDVSAYHLFYADGKATPGTDLTFFDWPARREVRGTRSIVRTGLRVADEAALDWWATRFNESGVSHGEISERDGRRVMDFEDFEGQRFALTADPDGPAGQPWDRSPVPAERRIRGLGPIVLSVPDPDPTDRLLREALNMRQVRDYSISGGAHSPNKVPVRVYEMGEGGAAAELHLAVEPDAPRARQGAGGVHHVALRAPTEEAYYGWIKHLARQEISTSGPVNRYYFRSLYFHDPNGILFEIATDGPGFDIDEPMEQLGEKLALPPFLESRRTEIEAGLKPLE